MSSSGSFEIASTSQQEVSASKSRFKKRRTDYVPSSPKRVKHRDNGDEYNVTEMRGRMYTLSPVTSPTKSRSTRPRASNAKRSISFTDNTVDETNSNHPGTKRRKVAGGTKRSRSSTSRQESMESKAAAAQDVTFSSTVVSKWQPIVPEVTSLFEDVLLASMGHCVNDLSGRRKSRTERYLLDVIKNVKTELRSVTAPRHKGMKSIIGARQKMLELKENCLTIVQRNTDIKKRLEERKRMVEEMDSKTKCLLEASTSHRTVSPRSQIREDVQFDSDDSFKDYLSKLIVTSRQVDCDTSH